ncbi:hypothetical protein KLP28_06450 [Nocardioidaceae bacterium]|nr:hypothetical protein KLP28_06450 [Nocardioidaceae bacterium]
MNGTPHDDGDRGDRGDQAFVARLRDAYDQQPAHAAPAPRAGRTSVGRRGPARRWFAVGAVVALAAAVPIVGAQLLDESTRTTSPAAPAPPSQPADATPSAGDSIDGRDLRACQVGELELRVGDDLSLPGNRRGRVVRLLTDRDRVCQLTDPVRVRAAVGPASDGTPPVRDTVTVPGGPFRLGPDGGPTFMVSAEDCGVIDAARGTITRFSVATGGAGTQIADELGTTGTCGELAIDWVVNEGLDEDGTARPLVGRIMVRDGLVRGQPSRIVATIRNTSEAPQTVSRCALRALPGVGLRVVPERCDDTDERTLSPGGTTRLSLTRVFMDPAGQSFAFTLDGVSAKVEVVTVQPRG